VLLKGAQGRGEDLPGEEVGVREGGGGKWSLGLAGARAERGELGELLMVNVSG